MPNREAILNIHVSDKDAGARLDQFLSGQVRLSRSYLQKLIRDSFVLVNNRSEKANYRIRQDDQIRVLVPEAEELQAKPENIPLDILFEDEDILIINKPQGMVVHPAPGHPDHTLVNAVLFHCDGQLSGINGILRPGIVHRIDKDTSGALVICKTDRAHRALAERLAVHDINRKYRAIIYGRLPEQDLTVSGNIGRNPKDRKKMAVLKDGGKPAVTHIHLLQELERGFTYVECSLETGRTHQIRVHLSSIGHPILGDPLYGPEKCPIRGLHGQTLHAMTLGFRHPVSGTYMEFCAPLPDYFTDILCKLGYQKGDERTDTPDQSGI